jgi:alpha-tubulin suppressor-like RCC1 family protein
VSAGGLHSAALRTDSTLWTWGYNDVGQLGLGGTADRSSPEELGSTWTQVSAGSDYTLAIQSNGTLDAWGDNIYGELGDGTTTQHTTPEKIGTATTWKQVSASLGGVTSAAVRTDGTLWTWGNNAGGQLGDGTTFTHASPEQIGTATNWDTVASGGGATIALRG